MNMHKTRQSSIHHGLSYEKRTLSIPMEMIQRPKDIDKFWNKASINTSKECEKGKMLSKEHNNESLSIYHLRFVQDQEALASLILP